MKSNINKFFGNLIFDAKQDRIFRYVVGAVIENQSKYLLLQRISEDFMEGIYELPSGKVEDGETLYEALRREIQEETSLQLIDIEEYLGCFDYYSKRNLKSRQFNFKISVKRPISIQLAEHNAYEWVSFENLNKYPVTDSVKRILYKQKMKND